LRRNIANHITTNYLRNDAWLGNFMDKKEKGELKKNSKEDSGSVASTF